ncbi:MAG: energy transducer TonB [Bradyrhizobium sp.]|nr:energy transducer TonB [Bradyrhizobium sp.]
MSEGLAANRADDQEMPQPDWHAVAQPLVSLRSLALVGLLVPLLLMAGVFWLHRLPSGTAQRFSDDVVDVRLIGQQETSVPPQDMPQPVQTSLKQETDPLVNDPDHSIPENAVEPSPLPAQPLPQRPAAAPTSSSDMPRLSIDREAATFQQALLSHIARYRHYPERARRDRARGTVRLVFSMLRDGTVTDVRIASSSGFDVLDAAAVETIRNAAPMPRIPAELPEHLNIHVPVAFDLP